MPSLSARLRMRLARLFWPHVSPFAVPERPTFIGDGLLTANGSDFLREARFQHAYAAAKATGSWWNHDLQWRAYVVAWAAMQGCALEGDFVECGVHRGGFSRMIAEYVELRRLPQKKLYMIDTYSGVPARFGGEKFQGGYVECYDDVVRAFADLPNAIIIRGEIPEVLETVPVEKVSFLSIDLNSVEPSIAALEHFWPRMSRGAVVVLDDYNFTFFHDQKEAFDAYAPTIGVEILSLPTGQGLLVKT